MAFSCGKVRAQKKVLNFKHLTINEGLSQNTIFCIYQDQQGFIWLGTEDGLNRYDGYEFRTFKNELNKNKSLKNNQVNAIAEDGQNRLVIGTHGGISIFNRDTEDFTNINIPSSKKDSQSANFVTAVVSDGQGKMWLGTYDGLKVYDQEIGRFMTVHLPGAFNQKNVQTLFIDNTEKLWISFKNELRCLDLKLFRFVALPKPLIAELKKKQANIRLIKQDKNGNLWLGSEQSGLFFYDKSSERCINYVNSLKNVNSLPSDVVRDVLFNNDGLVWIATRNGLSIFDPLSGNFTNFKHDKYDAASLSHKSVLKIMKDRTGSIWIGTYAGGVNIYNPVNLNFINIGEQMGSNPGLTNPVVSSIVATANDDLWIGTEGGGLNLVNRTTGKYEFHNLVRRDLMASENIIKSLSRDFKGNLWVGAFDGLYYFDLNRKQFTEQRLKMGSGFKGRVQVYAVLADSLAVWAGTNGGGLVYYDPANKTEKVFTHSDENLNSIIGNYVSALVKDKYGNLWVATLQGLCYLDVQRDKFKRYVHNPASKYSLTGNNVISLFIDNQDRLWIGTRGAGLNLYEPKSDRFYAFTEQNGLANNVIRAINQDKGGNLWVSSNKGLTRLNIALDNGKPILKTLKNYTVADGLQSNQFFSGATTRSARSELFFGGINGVTSFFPDQIQVNKNTPGIVFTDFLIHNKRLPIGTDGSPMKKHINESRKITIAYDQAYITVKFAALDFINAAKNSYAYKLDGLRNEDWHFVGNQRTATYTNLSPGKYTFMVKASNNDGLWGKTVSEISIEVLPPWYKTWWAYMLYLAIFSALLYLFYYFSLATAKLKNELDFEQRNHEKDLELSQRKLTFFTHISHEIKTPLTLILSPIEKLLDNRTLNNKVQQQLQLIHRNGERLMQLTSQLLDYRKFETGNMKLQAAEGDMVKFNREIVAMFQPYAASKGINLELFTTQRSINLWFDSDKMEKIMYNLISNALKFTPAGGSVVVQLDLAKDNDREELVLQVEDNGIGIAPENLDAIFDQFQYYNTHGLNHKGTGLGLTFSKGLVEMHHGKIEVSSTVATGETEGKTIFKLRLPLGNSHLQQDELLLEDVNSEDIVAYQQATPLELNAETLIQKENLLTAASQQRLVLLIVEDNEEVLQFVANHFSAHFEVLRAVDGNSGWEQAKESLPDLVISDVMMPGITGITLCSKIKSDPVTSHIPVILLTAREALLFKIEGLETGADDYIVKPFNLKYLEARVWNLLESRRKLREKFSRNMTLQPLNIAVSSLDEKFLEKAIKYVEVHMAKDTLGVEELSREVGMSKTTLYRKLKALTNQNTNEFIRTIRLNRAAQLLLQQKLNVSEVAYYVGFNDQDYFRKCFKEQFGTTPKDYANKSV
ncbi:two-component regulator propeller domain-containing protein [Pedobacter heparinus]|uniref:hybrid sensor histidine kinase/response regulator transcription factor n=1 Tax=Pedobacter heparinus TaxID=984 RepID=UPI00292FE3AE|nr:two-component regulator propeller domain-containing protein [Pedobacter heparinus]